MLGQYIFLVVSYLVMLLVAAYPPLKPKLPHRIHSGSYYALMGQQVNEVPLTEINLPKKLSEFSDSGEVGNIHEPLNTTRSIDPPPTTRVEDTVQDIKVVNKLPLPFLDVESIGLSGRWVEKYGNFVMKPMTTTPRGVIHFLGGAFVGAAPHLTYRYLLDSLCDAGFIIVATPYRLEMDYVRSCDSILSNFDAIAIELAKEFGALPVIGIGHSCGALLQVLITSLFPDAPRALNVLISFNNRQAAAAIPAYEEIIIPLSMQLNAENIQASNFRSVLSNLRSTIGSTANAFASSAVVPAFVGREILPLLTQSLEMADQIPPLLQSIAAGQREFTPSPSETKEVCRRMYRARSTLLVKFENDDLDESEGIEKVLREANTIMRMKRPMVEMKVNLRTISGTHLTPLTQNLFPDPTDLGFPAATPDPGKPIREQLKANFLRTVNDVKNEIMLFLDESLLPVS